MTFFGSGGCGGGRGLVDCCVGAGVDAATIGADAAADDDDSGMFVLFCFVCVCVCVCLCLYDPPSSGA